MLKHSFFLHAPKQRLPQSSFRLLRFYSPRMTASLSITSTLVWLADGWKDGGWRVGGWAIMGLCVTVRACLQHYLSSQQMRWERQVRRGWALFKSLFTVPTEPTLAFPNGASQTRHLMLFLVIPMSSVLVCCRQYRHYNTWPEFTHCIFASCRTPNLFNPLLPYLCLNHSVKAVVLSSPVVAWSSDLSEQWGLTVRVTVRG